MLGFFSMGKSTVMRKTIFEITSTASSALSDSNVRAKSLKVTVACHTRKRAYAYVYTYSM